MCIFNFLLQLVAGEVVSLPEEEQGTEMKISGAAETLVVQVEDMVEVILMEVVEDEVVKVTNKEEGEADGEVA